MAGPALTRRRSLNGTGDSPQLRVRISDDLRAALTERAAREQVTVSELARRILTDAVAGPHVTDTAPLRLTGPPGRRLLERRREVLDASARHGLTNVRLFGSVARGEDGPSSDIDLLVDPPDGISLIMVGSVERELEQILGVTVELVPASDLKPEVSTRVLAESIPL